MRVLMVSHTYAATANRAKLEALGRRVSLDVVVPSRWRDPLFTLSARSGAMDTYRLHALPARYDGRALRHWYPLRRLAGIIAQVKPDLVHVEEEPPSLALAQLALLKHWHGYKLTCFTWENINRRSGAPGIERYNLARCDGIVAGSEGAQEVVRAKGYTGPCMILPQLGVEASVAENGTGDDVRKAHGLNGFVVGFAGRLTIDKGLHTLLEAVEGLAGSQLLVVGGGPLRGTLAAAQARPIWADRMVLAGVVSHEMVGQYLQAMDVLVLPSLTTPHWIEQFGHVLIEAMARGVTVIGSSSGAIPEVIGGAGIIFPEGDAGALRQALERMMSNPDERARLGSAGRERVLAHYTHDHIGAQSVAFFRTLVGEA